MALDLDEMERIVQPEPEQEPQLPGAPVDYQADSATDYLELFVQTNCGFEFEAQWSAGEGAAGTFIVTGAQQLAVLVDRLRMGAPQLQGQLSPKTSVTVPEDKREGAGIPRHAEQFCYIYPLKSFSNLLWPDAADELRNMRQESGSGALSKWIDVVLEGGYVYFDEDGEIIRVNAISLQPTETEMVFRGRPLLGDRAQAIVSKMEQAGRLADIVEEREFTAGFTKLGWINPGETFDGEKVTEDDEYEDGAFLIIKPSGPAADADADGTAALTAWFYPMIDPSDDHYATFKHNAEQRFASSEHDGTFSGAYNQAVRDQKAHAVHTDYRDYLAISIEQDVSLQIDTNWAGEDEEVSSGAFEVKGPELQLKILQSKLELTKSQLQGALSPKHMVTVPAESRAGAGIPAKAEKFCFIFPLKDQHALAQIRTASLLQLARNPWAFTLLAGGFAYFDEYGNVLAVNAISFAPSATGLLLIGYEVNAVYAVNTMEQDKRTVEIREPKELTYLGVHKYGWVHPDEEFGGKKLSDQHAYENGAFLYTRVCRDGTPKIYMYSLMVSVNPDYPGALAKAMELQQRFQDRRFQPSYDTDPLSSGYTEAIRRAIAEQKQSEEAKDLLEQAFHPTQHEEKFKWWSLSEEARKASRVKANLFRFLVLGGFVAIGVVFYAGSGSDWDSGDDAWSKTEAAYFAVVTMSTVGYGDLTINQDRVDAMLFTAAYILVGVLVVFQYAGELYDELFHTETGLIVSTARDLQSWVERQHSRVQVKESFDLVDDDGNGYLEIRELAQFVSKAREVTVLKDVIEGHPRPFELETDWKMMRADADTAEQEVERLQKAASKAEANLEAATAKGDKAEMKEAQKELTRLKDLQKTADINLAEFNGVPGVSFSMFMEWWKGRKKDAVESQGQEDAVDKSVEEGKRAKQLSTWKFFRQHLLPSIMVGFAVNIILAALIFKMIEPADCVDDCESCVDCIDCIECIPYSSYLWHCFITSTTVGYGDVIAGRAVPHTMLIWASFQILMSVSWLASTAAQVTEALEKRGYEQEKVEALNNELNPSVIKDLEHFIVDGRVDKWGFVLGKLIGQGAQLWGEDLTVDNQINSLAKQFELFDEYGSGYLSMDDLAHMLLQKQQETKLNAALEFAKNAQWDELDTVLFPPTPDGELAKECVLPNQVINSLPIGRNGKPRQYGLLHQLIACAVMDGHGEKSCLSLTPMDSGQRYAKQGLMMHHKLVWPEKFNRSHKPIVFDYSLKTSKGDTCMDVTEGNRHSYPEPEVWSNDLFADFLLGTSSLKCPMNVFKLHDEMYNFAQVKNWTAVEDCIFDKETKEQVLANALINSLPMATDSDGRNLRRWGGLLHLLAECGEGGLEVHDKLVARGVSFFYNLKTFDFQNPKQLGKTCDQVAQENNNKKFLEMVRRKRLEKACKAAVKQDAKRIVDLAFDSDTEDQLIPDDVINSVISRPQLLGTPQNNVERWGLVHHLANWSSESRDKNTGTTVHDILAGKGLRFDYGLKTELELPTETAPGSEPESEPEAESGRGDGKTLALHRAHYTEHDLRSLGGAHQRRTCVDVAQEAHNTQFTDMLLNVACNHTKERRLDELEEVIFDDDGDLAIPIELLNSLPVTRGGRSDKALLHHLAEWVEWVEWKDPESGTVQKWNGLRVHDRLVSEDRSEEKRVVFNYGLKTPRGIDGQPPRTVGEVAQDAGNTGFLAMLLNRACDCAKRMEADRLEELLFDSAGELLIPLELVNSLPIGRDGTQRWGMLHHLASWCKLDPNTLLPRPDHGLSVHDSLVERGVIFDYTLKNPRGRTAVEIAEREGNAEFAQMVQEALAAELTATRSAKVAAGRPGAKVNP